MERFRIPIVQFQKNERTTKSPTTATTVLGLRIRVVRCLPTVLLILAFGSLLVAWNTTRELLGLDYQYNSDGFEVGGKDSSNSSFSSSFSSSSSLAQLGILATVNETQRRTTEWASASGYYNATNATIKEAASPTTTPPLKLVHVWAPYVVPLESSNGKINVFYPLDQAQNVTWGSMLRAQEAFNSKNQKDHTIQVWCAILWMDVEILQNHRPSFLSSSLCQPNNTILLNRSSHTEYPDLLPPIHFPFVQDILQVPVDYDYLILTNADISLIQSFYTQIQTQIRENDYDAFTVNRRQLPKSYRGSPLNSNYLSVIENELIPKGRGHPGTDCFILKKEIVQSYSLGKLFVGHPPWGNVLKNSLKNYVAANFKNLSSTTTGWTFHLRNNPKWTKSKFERNLTDKEDAFLDECAFGTTPRFFNTEHGLQNLKNCAEITLGLMDFITGKNDDNVTTTTPKFLTSLGVKRVEQFGLSRIPIITNWRQKGRNGSISGEVWNSRDLKDGVVIKIRQVMNRAWAGGFVITRFGGIYKLDQEEES